MSLEIFDAFNLLLSAGDDNSTEEVSTCEGISPQTLYPILVAPAVFFTILLSFTKRRNYRWLDKCKGRPALLFPQDVLARSNRFSYAAAFGSIAYLCYNVIFGAQNAVELDESVIYIKVFMKLLSMIIYGICYFPLFASLAVDNIPGYIVGTLYALFFTFIRFYNTFHCAKLDTEEIGILIARGFPELSCLVYLCLSLPVRLIQRLLKRDVKTYEDYDEFIRSSYYGIHVRNLLKKPEPPPPPPESLKNKAWLLLKSLASRFIYQKVPNFRYSGRVISVMVVGAIVIYMATVELMVEFVYLFNYLKDTIEYVLGTENIDDDIRLTFEFGWYVVTTLRDCYITSLSVALFINIIIILHTLSSYRTALLSLYKGNPMHLTRKELKSNPSLVVGSMRYAGYQVAYIAWGFLIQSIVLFVISVAIATFVTLISWKIVDQWFLDQINKVWPVLLMGFAVNIIQWALAKFAFLQGKGNHLRLNNRRLFFVVVYFFFFYNIFIGLISCILRIVKSIVIGTLFLSRIDHSTLPLKFQTMDPGFDAFCGFMHVEAAHTNPIAFTFIRILKSYVILSEEKKSSSDRQFKKTECDLTRKSRFIRGKWQLAYTLIRNPQLLVQRKQDAMKMLNLYETNNITSVDSVAVNMIDDIPLKPMNATKIYIA